MPHVVVKLYAGRSEEQKHRLAADIASALQSALDSSEESISVGIEDVAPSDWAEQVYRPDILGKLATLYKKPGYDPLR
jgi:4-oxalocrotonate tautomerase